MIVGCKPTGSSVLVRHLTQQETLNTKLHISGGTATDIPQGIILAIGPTVGDIDKLGFKVGDRVIFNGKGTMVPSWDENEYGLVEPHVIKGVVLTQEDA